MSRQQPRWTIRELGDEVAAALAHDYRGPTSGQVSPVPGVRSIRYYAGLGLLDRPVEMRGRTAYYTTRHLLQLVAIKRLQEAGKSLAEIQAALTGASDATLSNLARLPDAPVPTSGPSRERSGRPSFWRELPEESAATAGPYRAPAPPPAPAAPPRVRRWIEVEVAAGVRVQVETDRALTDTDTDNLQAAAAQLVHTVESMGLRPRA